MAAFLIGTGRGRSMRRRATMMHEINVTPMVDVMLVLLVIFMITAPLLTATVDVDLPKTQAAQASGQDEPLVVSVTAGGKVFLQDTEMELDGLVPRLQAITQNKPNQRIFVRGDQKVAYGRVLEVMGTISAAGFTRVALVAEIPTATKLSPQSGQRR
ncbi:MAG: protein TolR [Proteobacteria bacterium]|nr:protein TolR [Pseudomonadota bacterium]